MSGSPESEKQGMFAHIGPSPSIKFANDDGPDALQGAVQGRFKRRPFGGFGMGMKPQVEQIEVRLSRFWNGCAAWPRSWGSRTPPGYLRDRPVHDNDKADIKAMIERDLVEHAHLVDRFLSAADLFSMDARASQVTRYSQNLTFLIWLICW